MLKELIQETGASVLHQILMQVHPSSCTNVSVTELHSIWCNKLAKKKFVQESLQDVSEVLVQVDS